MKRSRLLVFVLVLAGSAAVSRADLNSDIHALLADKSVSKGELGIYIVRLNETRASSTVVFDHKSRIPRIPASNLKLITASAAIDQLGADFKFRTTLARRGTDLAIIGDGDPTLGDVEMLKKVGWGVDTVFKAWADLFTQHGITEVGDIYVDDSIFDEMFVHPNWPTDQLHKRYEPQVAGVSLNANCVDFYVRTTGSGNLVEYRIDPPTSYVSVANTCITGTTNAIWLSRQLGTNSIILRGQTDVSIDAPVSVTIHDPPLFAATVFSETLARNGVRMKGEVKRDRTIRASLAIPGPTSMPADKWLPIAIHSTPLSTVLNRMNKDSMNLYAESLCKRVGASVTGQSGSWENGVAAISKMLGKLDVSADEFSLDDGCGLSKKNQISPRAVTRVLEHQFYSDNRAEFLQSLSIAGIDGTLDDRFRDTDLRGRVIGKSGYVLGVRSLSGYLHAKDGQWYAFSILMNALNGADPQPKVVQERIIRAVDVASGASVSSSQ